MTTIVAAVGGGNWATGSTWVGGNAPTAADDVQIPITAGNITVTSTVACRSLDCDTYLGVLTISSSASIEIGDATAGLSNIALRLSSGMTLSHNSLSQIWFKSTSSTQQTVTTAGIESTSMVFNGSGGSWILSDALTIGFQRSLSFGQGTFAQNGQAISVGSFSATGNTVRSVTLDSTVTLTNSAITVWDVSTQAQTNSVITLTGSTIICSGGSATATTFAGADRTDYNEVRFTGSGLPTITGTNTFVTLTRTGTASKLDYWQLNANQTVSGTLTINGNSTTNRVKALSNTIGTARTLTAATVSVTNADFKDITGAGAGSWDLSAVTGGSGDCGGNSGITFTTAATQYWSSGTGSWSNAAKWFLATAGGGGAGRVPLPQDNVVFDSSSFSAGSQTVTGDMPRCGKDITLTGITNSPTFSMSVSGGLSQYGSITLVSGMTWTVSGGWTFAGRGSHTVTSAGKSFNCPITVAAQGGSYTQQDAFSQTSTGTFTNSQGGWFSNGFNFTTRSWNAGGSAGTRTIDITNSTCTNTGTGGCMQFGISTGLTFVSTGSTLVFSDTSGSSKTFVSAASMVWNDYTVAGGGAGAMIVTGATLTFRNITCGAPKTFTWENGRTTTITRFIPQSSPGNVITLNSQSAGVAFTWTSSFYMHQFDYLSVQDMTVAGTAKWYAGAHSTNVSGNSGWQTVAGGTAFNDAGKMLALAA